METFSASLVIWGGGGGDSPVSGEFPAQRPVTRNFNVFFGLRLNELLSEHSWGWWLETLSRPLWHLSKVSHAPSCLFILKKLDITPTPSQTPYFHFADVTYFFGPL